MLLLPRGAAFLHILLLELSDFNKKRKEMASRAMENIFKLLKSLYLPAGIWYIEHISISAQVFGKEVDMSLFGKLLKNVVSDTVGKAVSDSVEKAVSGIRDQVKEAGIDLEKLDLSASSGDGSVHASGSGDYFKIHLPEDDEDVRDKLLKVLAEGFPQCEVRENVSPLTIGAWGKPMDYSVGVYKDGEPALFIMFISRNTTRLRAYRWAKEAAAAKGIPMINFVRSYPNRYEYITERLHKYL